MTFSVSTAPKEKVVEVKMSKNKKKKLKKKKKRQQQLIEMQMQQLEQLDKEKVVCLCWTLFDASCEIHVHLTTSDESLIFRLRSWGDTENRLCVDQRTGTVFA